MRLAIVSDVHLRDPRSARQREFVEWLDALEVDELLLLGDIFHVWAGIEASPPSVVAPAVHALEALSSRGVKVSLVLGNHELGVGPLLARWVRGPTIAHVRHIGPLRVLMAHGDEGDRRAGYRVLQRALRSRLTGVCLQAAGSERARRWLGTIAGSGDAYSAVDEALVMAQRRWADERLQHELDVVVMGHSHVANMTRRPQGLIVHSGAWAGLRTYVHIDGAQIELRMARGGGAYEVLDTECVG